MAPAMCGASCVDETEPPRVEPEIVVTIVAAAVSAGSAILSVAAGFRIARLQHDLTVEREVQARKVRLSDVMSRFREPVLRSAVDLQSRLYNIAVNRFLQRYYFGSESDRSYATTSTLYVIAEYFGWVEILRREIQYLDLGDLHANKSLTDSLERISDLFLTDRIDDAFRVFRGEQRAIGELMLVKRRFDDPFRYECLGYAAFSDRLTDDAFARWFARLTADVERLANHEHASQRRLHELQHALVDLIDFLDPDFARVPERRRQKISGAPLLPSFTDSAPRPHVQDLE